jgi:hypothetical protein
MESDTCRGLTTAAVRKKKESTKLALKCERKREVPVSLTNSSPSLVLVYLSILPSANARLGLGPNSVLDDASVLDRLFRMRNDFGLKLGLSVTGDQQSATIDRAIEV